MKKKTVITTEKREIWVIRRGSEASHEPEESLGPDLSGEAAMAMLKELQSENGAPEDETDEVKRQ
ncbi:MAG: hypothetical protein M3R52_13025 [Acidobacteriota bacterium]|nr:hypothetical protein [Acidobacteriota bacterium]